MKEIVLSGTPLYFDRTRSPKRFSVAGVRDSEVAAYLDRIYGDDHKLKVLADFIYEMRFHKCATLSASDFQRFALGLRDHVLMHPGIDYHAVKWACRWWKKWEHNFPNPPALAFLCKAYMGARSYYLNAECE